MADFEGVTAGQLMVTYEHSDWRNGEHSRDMTLALLTSISSHFMQEHFGPDLPPPCTLPPSNIMMCGPQVDPVGIHAPALAAKGRLQSAVQEGARHGPRCPCSALTQPHSSSSPPSLPTF
jgi:hypothetical protein